ncbi:aquaporin-like protein [Aspergillus egyptiacus]|nr:aquaporin-like protein [Aspergillus egyptiacus]
MADRDPARPRAQTNVFSPKQLESAMKNAYKPGHRPPAALTSRTTVAERTRGGFTLAGPDDTPQLRMAHEPFVHPGYADLNPEYEQPPSAKPVWSLAKPLPRVVRPGMVPTKEELLQSRANAQLPAEQSQKQGLEVDPNELEEGRIGKSADPRKMAAQVDDARLQRENTFVNKILTGEATSTRISRTSSGRVRRPSVAIGPVATEHEDDQLPAVPEAEGHGVPPDELHHDLSDEPLHTVPEEVPSPEISPDQLTDFTEAEAAYPDDLHPLIDELVEEEIHNNHTVWSVIRTHHREALAESLAVFIQLTVGLSANLSVTLPATTNPTTTAWAWGLAAMMAIYISGGVSGAHLNPSITCMLWFYRGFPKRKMPEYFAAQFIGAFVASLAVYGLYYHSIQEYLSLASNTTTTPILNSFITSQRNPWIGPGTAFFNEFLGTIVLTVTVLALGDDQNAPPGAGMNALVIGLLVYALSITFSYQTGAALSPSRDFCPRLALLAVGYDPGDLFLDPYWFYGPWAGSFCGAFIGAFLYDFMIFTGGESPVNYPWERTRRAMKKSRVKWARRLKLAGGEGEKGGV